MATQVKIVIVGDETVGKTTLVQRLKTGQFEQNVPKIIEHTTIQDVQDRNAHRYTLETFDAGGFKNNENLRPLMYQNTNCFLVTFAINNPASLKQVTTKWIPEIKHHCPKIPFILVGLKKDLYSDEQKVTREKASKKATKLGAHGYIECSSLNGEGVKELILAILDTNKQH